jgi:uncharacterized repeat protein (TIGR01451 family)
MQISKRRRGRIGLGVLVFTAAAWTSVAAMAPSSTGAAVAQPSFAVVISPAYTTAGQPTTFTVTVRNTSTVNAPLAASNLVPPKGFKLMRVSLLHHARGKARVQHNMALVQGTSVPRGGVVQTTVMAVAPISECGKGTFRWSSAASVGTVRGASDLGPGRRLALKRGRSHLGTTVVCPQAKPCAPSTVCSTTQSTNVSSYSARSNAATGTLQGGLDVGSHLICPGYRPKDPNWYDSIVNDTSPGVVFQITYTLKGIRPKFVRACVGLTYEFRTASGKLAHRGRLPNDTPGFTGVLPACGSAPTGPCLVSSTPSSDPKSKAGVDTNLVVQIPGSAPTGAPAGDPWFGP